MRPKGKGDSKPRVRRTKAQIEKAKKEAEKAAKESSSGGNSTKGGDKTEIEVETPNDDPPPVETKIDQVTTNEGDKTVLQAAPEPVVKKPIIGATPEQGANKMFADLNDFKSSVQQAPDPLPNDNSAFNEFTAGSQEQNPQQPQQTQEPQASAKITGYMLLLVVDIIVPGMLIFIWKKARGKKAENIQKSDIQLTHDEKNDLKELADQAAQQLSISMNPIAAFSITVLFMYGSKMMINEQSDNGSGGE